VVDALGLERVAQACAERTETLVRALTRIPGVAAAFATPILVSSDKPDFWALYLYLAIVTAWYVGAYLLVGIYGVAAVAMALTTIMLRRALPDHGRQLNITYRAQLRGVLDVARAEPALRWRALIGACGFGSFGCFWTTITFLLASPQYGFSQLEIGLFALVGAAGAITSLAGGRAIDARPALRWPASGIALAVLALSYIPIGLGGAHLGWISLALLVVGVLVMDACVQGSHVINQSVIYDLLPEARSRLTTVYITTMFAGGALGSFAGAQAYEAWGWTGATLTAAAFPVAGLLCWAATRRHERA